ncbi:MAG: NAD(P)H-hydrate dehydratase, partial [bacterium]
MPQALAHRWPVQSESQQADAPRYTALAIGAGLGRTQEAAMLLQRLLDGHRGTPLVLDADALWRAADAANALGTDTTSMLRHWVRETPEAVCTPHPGEFARLLGTPLPDVWEERATLLAQFAARAGCTVLL